MADSVISLPNNKNVDSSKLKAKADDNLNAAVMIFKRVENMVGTSIFSFSHNVFKSSPLPLLKVSIVLWKILSLLLQNGLTHYQTTILEWFKLKQSTDDNFKFDENTRKFSKRVENTVDKGEIARHQQFLPFPVFSKGLFPRVSKGVNVLE